MKVEVIFETKKLNLNNMGNFNKDGFIFFKSIDYGTHIVFDFEKTEECIRYIEKEKITNIFFNTFTEGVKEIVFPTHITSLMLNNVDFEKIPVFENVKKVIILYEVMNNIESSTFPKLEFLAIDHKNCKNGLSEFKNIKHLILRDFLKEKQGFLTFTMNTEITHLVIQNSDITTLVGLESYNLISLGLVRCKKLSNIDALLAHRKSMKFLNIDYCKKINTLEAIISNLINLQKLGLNELKELKSLDFLESLKKLQHLTFVGTTILDGILNICKKYKYVGFEDKKHYNLKFKELNPSWG